MKRLHEAITEAARLTESQPSSDEELTSLLQSIHEVARHGNAGVLALASTLFPPRQ